MKHIYLSLIFLATAFSASANDALSAAQKADEFYRHANYDSAIALYESALAQGQASADLYYNLGNAYYRNGQNGLAILNYERALRLRPNMSDAKDNLALAESKTADRIAVLPKLFFVQWYTDLSHSISPTGWRIVWLCLLTLLMASIVLLRIGHTLSLRKTGLIAGIILLTLLILASFLWGSSAARFNSHSEAIVMQPAITVKSSPEHQSVDKLILHEGTKVRITESLSGWYKIVLSDGTTGWCEPSAVERI